MRPNHVLSTMAVAMSLPLRALAQANPILGTKTLNISSESTQMSYVATWRSDVTEDGIYQAYSNETDAAMTFTFVGVQAQYVAERGQYRGLCQLVVDEEVSYTIDLYDGSGYQSARQIIWSSGTLPYGVHNVTLMQIGPDARFGFYPYLLTETWIETVPISPFSYTQTQILPTETGRSSSNDNNDGSSSTNIGPIIGGVVGGVLAVFLATFLIFLWRRDQTSRERGPGDIQRPKKEAAGKMAIEDEGPEPGWAGSGGAAFAGYGAGQQQQSGYRPEGPVDWSGSSASHYHTAPGSGVSREGSGHSYTSQHGLLPSGAAYGMSPPPPSSQPVPGRVTSPPGAMGGYYPSNPYQGLQEPVPYRGITPESYPHVVQGEDRRRYAVPEI